MGQLNIFETRPKHQGIDVKQYLECLGLPKPSDLSVRFLFLLHQRHIQRFPFENLDIHWKRTIRLDIQGFYKKIILSSGRGGFCYELNGLFFHLLVQLGYNCQLISCRVMEKNGTIGPAEGHMAVLVEFDDKLWLADVGFGDLFSSPKELVAEKPQMDANRFFKFTLEQETVFTLWVSTDAATYRPLYKFTTEGYEFIQFLKMCDYHQTSPESIFTKEKLITKKTPTGRITLTDKLLKIEHVGEVIKNDILNEDEFYSKLMQHFDIAKPSE